MIYGSGVHRKRAIGNKPQEAKKENFMPQYPDPKRATE